MDAVFVVQGDEGEYSDRYQWIEGVWWSLDDVPEKCRNTLTYVITEYRRGSSEPYAFWEWRAGDRRRWEYRLFEKWDGKGTFTDFQKRMNAWYTRDGELVS